MITVYHGGTHTVERPVCMFGRENLDFGRGFYVTPLLKQASDWANTSAETGLRLGCRYCQTPEQQCSHKRLQFRQRSCYQGRQMQDIQRIRP